MPKFALLASIALCILPLAIVRSDTPNNLTASSRDQWMQRWVASRPAAAHNTSYWSPAFYGEANAWAVDFDESGYFKLADYHGQYVNVDGGIRRTMGQPTSASRTLYMLGNSQLYGLYVDDADTIASQIQAMIGNTYKVVNLGATARTAIHQLHLLKTLPVKPGDVVVWLDGLMETEAIYEALGASWPDALNNSALMNGQIADQVAQFKQAISDGYGWTIEHGATFYHFLQPHLWSIQPLPAEEGAEAFPLIEYRNLTIPRIYPAFEAALATLPGPQIDLLHILDVQREKGEIFYFDSAHLNAAGNTIIARAIYDATFPVF